MDLYSVYNQLGILFLTILIGYFLAKIKIITSSATQFLTKYVLNIALPALVIAGMQIPYTPEKLQMAGSVFLLSIPCYALAYVVGILTAKILSRDHSQKAVFNFGIVFANTAYLGFPVFMVLFGKESIFYAAIYNILFGLLLYTLGAKIMRTHEIAPVHKNRIPLKEIFNPGVVASLVGLLLFITALPLPVFVIGTIDTLGNTCVPLSMLTIGAMLSELPLHKMFGNVRVYLLSVVRLVVMPLLILVMVKYIFGIDQMMLIAIPVIMAGMPIATNTVLMAIEYDNDAQLSSQAVLISTILSCLTIPLMILLLSHLH
ncbi:AEC family transporter [Dehalobacter sp. DCM]|uniref:AEC family transporter n=1 Tax=Dehalobacter sp. DCM TaxID=2907827 RepID=UPI0030812E9D|nr:AEC family transporter [Dehalobacter sp. DCM]